MGDYYDCYSEIVTHARFPKIWEICIYFLLHKFREQKCAVILLSSALLTITYLLQLGYSTTRELWCPLLFSNDFSLIFEFTFCHLALTPPTPRPHPRPNSDRIKGTGMKSKDPSNIYECTKTCCEICIFQTVI